MGSADLNATFYGPVKKVNIVLSIPVNLNTKPDYKYVKLMLTILISVIYLRMVFWEIYQYCKYLHNAQILYYVLQKSQTFCQVCHFSLEFRTYVKFSLPISALLVSTVQPRMEVL